MSEEQAALRQQFPRLIAALTSGDRDGDGESDMPAARNLHLGVVSTDLGLAGVSGIEHCDGLGVDGESALKALWPSDDQRITFLPDPQGLGSRACRRCRS